MDARKSGNKAHAWLPAIRSVGLGLFLCVQTLWSAETTNAPASGATSLSYVELLAASQVAVRQGELPQALALVATALRRSPHRPEAHVMAAQMLGATGRNQAARQMARRAVDLAAPVQKALVERTLQQWLTKEPATSAEGGHKPLPASSDTDWLISSPKSSQK